MTSVVVISTITPFPADVGKKVVLSGILKHLFERYGADHVSYILLGGEDEDGSAKKGLPCKLLVLKGPSVPARLRNVFWISLLRRRKSIQESMLYSARLGRELRATVAEVDPDLIICDTFRTGQFFETAERPEGRYVLYMDDLFSVRYQRMLEVLRRFPEARLNPLGNFAAFVPSFLRPSVQVPFVQKGLLQFEQKLVEQRERDCVKWFDRALLLNEEEVEVLRRRTERSSVQSIKPLLVAMGKATDRHYNGEPVFVFLGGLNLPHNQFSIIQFIRNQADKMIERMPDVRLRVIGRGAPGELLRLAKRYKDNISIEGFVDDLDVVFSESCAMIVPLLFGSGVKIKTLEALCRGLPVISTSFGVEGIGVTNRVNCIVENEIDRFPQAMADLLNLRYNARISRQAHDFYASNYTRERVFDEYDRAFGGT